MAREPMAAMKRPEQKGDSISDEELDRLEENISRILEEEYARTYSPEVIAEFRNPANVGVLPDADGKGLADGLCNDTVEMYLKIRDGKITACTFVTDGCGATIACASRLTRFVIGMTPTQARMVNPGDLISLLNGLPEDHKHCATLAVLALRNALRDYEERQGRRGYDEA